MDGGLKAQNRAQLNHYQRNEQLIPARNKYNDNYMNARRKLNEIERLRKTIYPLFSYDRDNTITKNQSIEHSR